MTVPGAYIPTLAFELTVIDPLEPAKVPIKTLLPVMFPLIMTLLELTKVKLLPPEEALRVTVPEPRLLTWTLPKVLAAKVVQLTRKPGVPICPVVVVRLTEFPVIA